jgi:hypothetical protein
LPPSFRFHFHFSSLLSPSSFYFRSFFLCLFLSFLIFLLSSFHFHIFFLYFFLFLSIHLTSTLSRLLPVLQDLRF